MTFINIFMKTIRHLFLILLVILPCSRVLAQTPKFGHVDLNAIFMVMPEYSAIQKTLDDETSKLESQLTVMQEDLRKLEDDFAQNAANMTTQQQQQKSEEYNEMMGKIQVFFTNAQESLQQKQMELQQPVIDKLNKAIDDVGAEEGFLYIFQASSTDVSFVMFHSAQSVDVTSFVKKKLGIH